MTLLEVIKTAPDVINHIVTNNDSEMTRKVLDHVKGNEFNRVVIVASGSSYNAAFAVKEFCEHDLSITMEINYPNVFLNAANVDLYNHRDLFIFISQGGETKEVFHSIKKIKAKGYRTLSITEDLTSSIAKLSDTAIKLGTIKEPYIFRTIGYDATCVTLTLTLAQAFNFKAFSVADEMIKTSENLPSVIKQAEGFYQMNREPLMESKVLVFIGANDLWPVSQEAAIKFMEMIPVYTLSYELEESIHGPQNAFDDKASYFISAKNKVECAKVKSVYQFIQHEVSENVFLISDEKTDESFQLSVSNSRFNYLEFVTFYQTVAYYLATDKGKDLGKVSYPQLTNYIQKKFED